MRKLEEAGPEPRREGKENALEGAAQGAVDIRGASADPAKKLVRNRGKTRGVAKFRILLLFKFFLLLE